MKLTNFTKQLMEVQRLGFYLVTHKSMGDFRLRMYVPPHEIQDFDATMAHGHRICLISDKDGQPILLEDVLSKAEIWGERIVSVDGKVRFE